MRSPLSSKWTPVSWTSISVDSTQEKLNTHIIPILFLLSMDKFWPTDFKGAWHYEVATIPSLTDTFPISSQVFSGSFSTEMFCC